MGALLKLGAAKLATPAGIVKVARAAYVGAASLTLWAWYMGWKNQRVPPGSHKFPIPIFSQTPASGSPDRPNPSIGDISGEVSATLPADRAASSGSGAFVNPVSPPNLSGRANPFASNRPAAVVQLANIAQTRFGLRASENPAFGGVHPVHATNSLHYLGRAVDISGSPGRMNAFAKWVTTHYGPWLTEFIHNGGKGNEYSIKNGRPVPPSFWGAQVWDAHKDHDHLGI